MRAVDIVFIVISVMIALSIFATSYMDWSIIAGDGLLYGIELTLAWAITRSTVSWLSRRKERRAAAA